MGTREEAKGPTSIPPQLVECLFTGQKEDFANIIKFHYVSAPAKSEYFKIKSQQLDQLKKM